MIPKRKFKKGMVWRQEINNTSIVVKRKQKIRTGGGRR
jgi:hypothetical protein